MLENMLTVQSTPYTLKKKTFFATNMLVLLDNKKAVEKKIYQKNGDKVLNTRAGRFTWR